MTPTEYWRWRYTDPETGREVRTSYRMSRLEVIKVDPDAQPIEGTMEIRLVPETRQEVMDMTPTGPSRAKP